jgi:hypothetical protein
MDIETFVIDCQGMRSRNTITEYQPMRIRRNALDMLSRQSFSQLCSRLGSRSDTDRSEIGAMIAFDELTT